MNWCWLVLCTHKHKHARTYTHARTQAQTRTHSHARTHAHVLASSSRSGIGNSHPLVRVLRQVLGIHHRLLKSPLQPREALRCNHNVVRRRRAGANLSHWWRLSKTLLDSAENKSERCLRLGLLAYPDQTSSKYRLIRLLQSC